MRGARSLLALLVVGLGLGAYIYFVESERDLTDPETRKERVFAIETGTIEEIELKTATGEATTLRRSGEAWQIVAPVTAPADEFAVSSIVSAIETLDLQRALDENPMAVGQFGLEPARMTVAFRTKSGTTLQRLNIGSKTPTGSDLYARVDGQPRLFLISGFLEDTFNRTTFDLRDKKVLAFDQPGVDRVQLSPASGGPAVALARDGGTWRLTTPVASRADQAAVDQLISRASQATFKAVVAGEPAPASAADLRKFGLDRPRFVLELGAGSSRVSLALGNALDDTSIYARDLSKPLVVTVDASLLTDLNKAADDLRVKDVFEFKPYTALSLDITSGGATSSFQKAKPAGGDATAADVWTQTKPAAREINQTGMTDLLNTLSALRAERFVAQAPPSGEDIVVAARSGETDKPVDERVTLRRAGGVVHAIRPNEPGAAVLPAAEFEKALTQLKELTGTK